MLETRWAIEHSFKPTTRPSKTVLARLSAFWGSQVELHPIRSYRTTLYLPSVQSTAVRIIEGEDHTSVLIGNPVLLPSRKNLNAEEVLDYASGERRRIDAIGGRFVIFHIDATSRAKLVSDLHGTLPTYYLNGSSGVIAAHDLRAVECLAGPLPINYDYIARYIVYRYDDVVGIPETPYQQVFLLQPAQEVAFEANKIPDCRQYWDFSELPTDDDLTRCEALQVLSPLVSDSVGTCFDGSPGSYALALSGGLDSTTAAAVAKQLGFEFTAITASYDVPTRLDESTTASSVASVVGCPWRHEEINASDFLRSWQGAYSFHALPVATSSIVGYDILAARVMDRGFNTLLLASQSDRLFAGHYSHYRYHLADKYHEGPPAFERELAAWISRHSTRQFPKSRGAYHSWIAQNVDLAVPGRIRPAPQPLDPQVTLPVAIDRGLEATAPFVYTGDTYLRSHIVHQVTRFEQHSVSARLTYQWQSKLNIRDCFADPLLFRFAWGLHGDLKIRDGLNKIILRDFSRQLLPDFVHSQQYKVGFDVPFATWLGHPEFHRHVVNVVQNADGELRQLIDVKSFIELVDAGNIAALHPMFVWQLSNACMWLAAR